MDSVQAGKNLDRSFGEDGYFVNRKYIDLQGVCTLNGGKAIRACAMAVQLSSSMYHVLGITPEGLADQAFGENGEVAISIPGGHYAVPTSMLTAVVGGVEVCYVLGEVVHGDMFRAFISRLHVDGSLDTSFGKQGTVLLNYPVSVPMPAIFPLNG